MAPDLYGNCSLQERVSPGNPHVPISHMTGWCNPDQLLSIPRNPRPQQGVVNTPIRVDSSWDPFHFQLELHTWLQQQTGREMRASC